MRILIITNMYPSESNLSYGIFVKNHINTLKRNKNIEIIIIASRDWRKGLVRKIFKYIRISLIIFYYSLFKKFDIIHAHFAFPTGFLALIPKIISRKKMIISVHGGDINKVAQRSSLNFKLCRLALNKADHIISNSNYIKEKLINDFGVSGNKISVVNIGVDTNYFKPLNKLKCRNQLKIGDSKKLILFIGNLIKLKGAIYLLEAIDIVKKTSAKKYDIECILIGNKSDRIYLKYLYDLMIRLKLGDKVKIMDPVPYKIVSIWMNSSDILVVPSLDEGFGLVALEALACGTPVIASSVGGLKEFIIDRETGFIVPPKNSKAIADKIIDILKDDQKILTAIKQEGFKVANNYSIDNQVKKIEKIYDEYT